ncbi:MAG TPA: cation:proton antiporter, partial [Nitrososphaeraceae archaeon]|nr:cation:proton antiporter [Nitrososphaeraceae archaeon]
SPGIIPGTSLSPFFVQDFAVIMIVAAVMLGITYKLKQPMVIGYILAGMVIGPYTPPFSLIHNVDTVNRFAELGIIMLLFVVGTEFPIAKLRSVGRTATIVALSETLGTLVLSFIVAQAMQLSYFDSIFLALAMSITSTVITVRILEELNMIKDRSTTLLLAISIIEDIIAIAALGVIQSIAEQSVSGIGVGVENELPVLPIAISISIVAAFIGIVLVFGSRFIPGIIDKIGKTNNYTLLLVSILGLAFGLSFLANFLGLSVATGAFLAGVLIAESKSAPISRVITIPLRDVFAAIFFISIGALMEVSLIPFFIVPALVLILVSIASKFLIVSIILIRSRYDTLTSIRTGLAIASAKGELSLVVAKGGQDTGAVSSAVFPIVGIMTPYVLRFGSRLKISSPS